MSAPRIWLLLLCIGLPHLAESMYSPALLKMSEDLNITHAMAEHTFSVYLLATALGVFGWGQLSDRLGRRPCMLVALLIYVLGSALCFFATDIYFLFLGRFVQGLGGAGGSILGQAIQRDSYRGVELARTFALIGSALAFFPAMGPVLGTFITHYMAWPYIFMFLSFTGIIIWLLVIFKLPESNTTPPDNKGLLKSVFTRFIRDPKVLITGFLIAACKGMTFAYYAEGSFYMVEMLELSPEYFGLSFILLALSASSSGLTARLFQHRFMPLQFMSFGVAVLITTTTGLVLLNLLNAKVGLSNAAMVILSLIAVMLINAATTIIATNASATALSKYRDAVGTAQSLYSLYYYLIKSTVVLGMALLHDGTLLAMPLYYWFISLGMGGALWAYSASTRVRDRLQAG